MAGEYRTNDVLDRMKVELGQPLRDGTRRMALTNGPTTGAARRPDLSEAYAAEYARLGMTKYARQLRDGDAVMIDLAPGGGTQVHFATGELFFTS